MTKVVLEGLSKHFGDVVAVNDIDLRINDGEFLTLVGPSGCGKTTTLRCIAGLESATDGKIYFDDVDVTDKTAKQRDIAFVFQDYALYPHMTARRNMSFALEDAGIPQDEIERKLTEVPEMLGISDQLDKKPGDLSGGQQQRVALGRSIVRDPKIFLLDEPLSNLDAKLRTKMRAELQKIHKELGTTMVYVTHDQEEALTMSDRMAIMNEGTIQQVCSPEIAYHKPVNRFVADFIGSPPMNIIPATPEDGTIEAGGFTVERPASIESDPVELGVRPEEFDVVQDGNGVPVRVKVFEQVGSHNILYTDVDGIDEEIIIQTDSSRYAEPGEMIELDIPEGRFRLFDAEGKTIYNPPIREDAISVQNPTA